MRSWPGKNHESFPFQTVAQIDRGRSVLLAFADIRRMLQNRNLGRVSIIFCTPELCKSPPAFSSVREQLVAGAWNMEIQICKVNIGNQLAWILGWKSNHFHWRLLLLDVQELTTVRRTLQVGRHLCNFVADSISQKQYFKIDSWACCFERKSHGIL